MAKSKTKTQRLGLRFSLESHILKFKTEFEDGLATIKNISTGGCALQDVSVPLAADDTILLLLPLGKNEDPVEIRARVVRVDKQYAAVQFSLISEENKQRIVKYCVQKQRIDRSLKI